jgi:O-antigen/teichoic acid export membrane protein
MKFITQNSALFKSFGTYSVANMLNAAIPFLLMPFISNHLSPAAYGVFSMFQVLTLFATAVVGFNCVSAIEREYFNSDQNDLRSFVTTALYLIAGSSAFVLVLFLLFGGYIERISDVPRNFLGAVVLLVLCQMVGEILLVIWRVEHKPKKFGAMRIAKTLLEIGLTYLFVLMIAANWISLVVAQLIASSVIALLTLYILRRKGIIFGHCKMSYASQILKFGIPLIPHAIGTTVTIFSNRLFITNMVGLAESGIYTTGFQIGQVIGLFQNSFNQAWVPFFYLKLKEGDDQIKVVKMTYLYFAVMTAIVVIFILMAPILFNIFIGKDFHSALRYVPWIAAGFAFNGMYKMVVNYLFYVQKTTIIGMGTIITAAINLVLNYFLIKQNGGIGAAQATAISFFLQFLIIWRISAHHYKMPWFFFLKSRNL